MKYLLVSIGESEGPGVVDEEDVGVLGHGVGGEDEAPLAAVLAGLDLEVVAAVEGLAGELLEEAAVQRLRQPRGRKQQGVDFGELVVGLDSVGGGGHGYHGGALALSLAAVHSNALQ